MPTFINQKVCFLTVYLFIHFFSADFTEACPCVVPNECPDVRECASGKIEDRVVSINGEECEVCQCVGCPVQCPADCHYSTHYTTREGCDICVCLDTIKRNYGYGYQDNES